MHTKLEHTHKQSYILLIVLMMLSSELLMANRVLQPSEPITPKTIFIHNPSTGSSLLSPISLQAEVICSSANYIVIELIDSNDHLLYRKLIKPDCEITPILNLTESIYFNTNKSDSPARLTVMLLDESSKFVAISSVDISLSKEKSVILPGVVNQIDFLILNPKEGSLSQGETLKVSGWVHPANDSPVIIELTLKSGKIIGSRQFLIDSDHLNGYQFFEIEVPYLIPGIQTVKLTMRQMGEKILGNVSLESQLIQLGP